MECFLKKKANTYLRTTIDMFNSQSLHMDSHTESEAYRTTDGLFKTENHYFIE